MFLLNCCVKKGLVTYGNPIQTASQYYGNEFIVKLIKHIMYSRTKH